MTSLQSRFETKVFYCTATGCHLWTASTNRGGYGTINVRRRSQLAHRVAYRMYVGEIQDGLALDHLCRTRNCVNPDHLRAVTQHENVHAPGSLTPSKELAARTQCPRGHKHAEWNCPPSAARVGYRKCLACSRAQGWGYFRGLRMDAPEVHAEADRRYQQLRMSAS